MPPQRLLASLLASFVLTSGACGARSSLPTDADEGAGGADVTCEPGAVTTPRGQAERIEIVGDDVYFTVRAGDGTGALLRVPVDGTSEPVVVVDGLMLAGDFTVADGALFVTDQGRIQRVGLDGTAPTTVYTGDDVAAFDIVGDDAGIYWLPAPDGITQGTIRFQPFGGAATTLVEGIGSVSGLAVVGSRLLFTALTVPFGNGDTNVVASIPKAGGAITVHATQRQNLSSPMQVGDRMGWLEFSPTRNALAGVYTMPIDGSAGPTLFLRPPEGDLPIVARARGDVVVMTSFDGLSDGGVYVASLDEPTRREIDRRAETPAEPALSDDVVAWAVLSRAASQQVDARWVCPW